MSTASQNIRKQIDDAVNQTAVHAELGIRDRAIEPIVDAVASKVTAPILHVTNNEPWYQSRVTWGAIVSIGTGLLGAVGVATDWLDAETAIALGMGLGSVIGGAVTLYGRWKARKPIGMA